MNFAAAIKGIFHKIEQFFESDKVKKVESTIAEIMPIALQFAQEADLFLGGNLTLELIISLANKWAVPVVNTLNSEDPQALENLLMNTVSYAVKKNLPAEKSGIALSLINAAVNSAVALAHA